MSGGDFVGWLLEASGLLLMYEGEAEERVRRFRLEVLDAPGVRIDSATMLSVDAAGSASVPLRLVLPAERAQSLAGQTLHATVRVVALDAAGEAGPEARVHAAFNVPR